MFSLKLMVELIIKETQVPISLKVGISKPHLFMWNVSGVSQNCKSYKDKINLRKVRDP